jgi:ankyrin
MPGTRHLTPDTSTLNIILRAIHVAAGLGDDVLLVKLIHLGVMLEPKDAWGQTPLHITCRLGPSFSNVDGVCGKDAPRTGAGAAGCAARLLNAGCNVNHIDNDGYACLHLATRSGAHHTVQVVLAGGANIHSLSLQGYTALHIAARWGRMRCVVVLLRKAQREHRTTILRFGKKKYKVRAECCCCLCMGV